MMADVVDITSKTKSAPARKSRSPAAQSPAPATDIPAEKPPKTSRAKAATKTATKSAPKPVRSAANADTVEAQEQRPRRARKAATPAPVAPVVQIEQPQLRRQPIWQIHFDVAQLPNLDPAFVALNNAEHPDPLREFAVFERLAKTPAARNASLWGALSWRFGLKTGMTGQALRQEIARHPGADLYFCNPHPENEALYANGWQQGSISHPAFYQLGGAVLKAAGLDVREIGSVQPSDAFSACNYFVGSPAFWSAYLPWMRSVLDRARAQLPAPVLRVLDSPLGDPSKRHASASYWPFIIERLLPQFLRSDAGKHLKVHKVALPQLEAKLSPHVRRLREMKDVAHRTNSQWLHACWANYRNLYLLQTAGREWWQRHHQLLTAPAEVEFW